jgi:hypothetical protein
MAPSPDQVAYAHLAAEGRAPFDGDGEGYDEEAMEATAAETLNSLIADLAAIADLDLMHEPGPSAFRGPRAWAQFDRAYPGRRQMHTESYDATLDAVTDVWGWTGRDAFDAEARRRTR